jgi:beta-galactosidase/beta-glucuronidase
MTAEEGPLHPTPQHRRSNWQDLSGGWGYAVDDDDVGRHRGWATDEAPFSRIITVPFPPESPASGIGDRSPHPTVWYRTTFRATALYPDGRVLLHFGAVDYEADVWLNGVHIGMHNGGNASFTLDGTDAMTTDTRDQVLAVRATDSPTDLSQPRGKQFWEETPRNIWYNRTTGIWQPVWLENVPADHISEIRWTPDALRGRLGIKVRLAREPVAGMRVRVRLSRAGVAIADDLYSATGTELERDLHLEPAVLEIGRRRLLWGPDHPNLIDAVVTIEDAGGRIVDEVHSYAGVRSVAAEDGRILLNGVPHYLRMVLSQGYWPESHLAAPGEAAIRAEVEWIKRLGFNGVRIHQKVEDPRFLYWCDRLGVLVWSEMASPYVFSGLAVERFVREWMEILRRDHSHPSIVTWVPFNESWGLPDLPGDAAQRAFVRGVYGLTKALDPSRPVAGNDGWEHTVGDILGLHDYSVRGADLRERYATEDDLEVTLTQVRPHHRRLVLPDLERTGQPVVISEFGGISYDPEPGRPWFGYGSVADSEALVDRYKELVDAILDSSAIAGFCYTQLTDVEQEANGLLFEDRTPKVDVDRIAGINRRASRAIPGEVMDEIHIAGEAIGSTARELT